MIIAISSKGEKLSSIADPHFGRAAGFVFYDTNTKATEYLSNSENKNASQGAGIQAASLMANKHAEVVVSGSFGPKAEQALTSQNIKMWTFSGDLSIQEVIEQIASGKIHG